MADKSGLSSTERQLRDALTRLVDQKPINKELKQKLKANKLKIVVSNVEKEAGLSNGSARRYPEIKALIEGAEATRVHGEGNVSDNVVRSHPLHIKAKEGLDKAKQEIKKLKEDIEKKEQKLGDYKKRLKSQAVRMHEVTVAMWKHIPEECKHIELMIDVEKTEATSNVREFKKREEFD